MRFRVTSDTPPPVLIEAATAYSTRCCSGILDLWRDATGYWQATLTHDLDCWESGAPLAEQVGRVSRPDVSAPDYEDLLTPLRAVRCAACAASPWRATRPARAYRRRSG
ncbi:hypothetical protein CcI49_28790 [Frankia sp. CcI49]|uniref:hypothetical protein n=1 Tax=Frankia sp. CcI49 TaxID=1745382 RepID=UPI00097607E9|nr:hypothetical protein [Frankia sp. CcI49]ONH55510.1 hypothetical protein CcI49_28790 [Frankia sp. CcI49]